MPRPKVGKVTKTINFDDWVLKELEKQGRAEQTSVSNIVNFIVSETIRKKGSYAKSMAQYHSAEFHKWKLVADDDIGGI